MSQVSWAVKLRPHRNRCEDSDSFIARPSSPLYPLKVRFLCPALLREKINPRLTLRSLPTSRCLFVRQGWIAAIMHIDPPGVSVLQPMTPASVDRMVKVCLAKDPDERWQTAH